MGNEYSVKNRNNITKHNTEKQTKKGKEKTFEKTQRIS